MLPSVWYDSKPGIYRLSLTLTKLCLPAFRRLPLRTAVNCSLPLYYIWWNTYCSRRLSCGCALATLRGRRFGHYVSLRLGTISLSWADLPGWPVRIASRAAQVKNFSSARQTATGDIFSSLFCWRMDAVRNASSVGAAIAAQNITPDARVFSTGVAWRRRWQEAGGRQRRMP